MEMHLRKEEAVLFPRITEIEKLVSQNTLPQMNISFISAPVSIMEQEHEHAGNLMEEIRKLTHNFTPPVDACTTYKLSFAALQNFEKDLHRHVHLENNILFPGATKLIKQLLN